MFSTCFQIPQHISSTFFYKFLSSKKLPRIFPYQIFSLAFVLQFKTSKIINDMAKINIKSEKTLLLEEYFTQESMKN